MKWMVGVIGLLFGTLTAQASFYGPAPVSLVATPRIHHAAPVMTSVASGARLSNWCVSYCGEPVMFLGCPQGEPVNTVTLACLAPAGGQNGTAYPAWHRPGMSYTNPPPRP